ncbi:glycosyltransferase family 2 protein [Pseudobacter ginsenosidimutans]|uniref:glycosyltransferase family 2 protein n=1 Tax=Pseudobacter ginsenosidimutans TaxID=661488 RepID=UPI0013158F86|nr:glycosyltransferase family 2 protein [Pseudobacter ginsenosidimutans]
MNPVVSVIVPNYNHAPYLKKRIDSILAQTFDDFELIILDDHSPDNSKNIIDNYLDHPKVSEIVFNESNVGNTFKQWEKGLLLARGEYIWIAESDDYAEPDFLERLVPALENDSETGIAFCESTWVDPKDNVVKNIELPSASQLMEGKTFVAEHMTRGNRIYNASMAIFRKKLFEKLPDQSYKQHRYCGDWLMWTQLASMGKVFYLNEKKSFFRRHTSSVSFKSDKEGLFLLEGLKVQRYIKEKIGLEDSVFTNTAKYWLDELLQQWIVKKALSVKVFFKALRLLAAYNSIIVVRLPVAFMNLTAGRVLTKFKNIYHKNAHAAAR